MSMRASLRPVKSGKGTDGFIIVVVLWMLAALAALVMVYAVYVVNAAVVTAAGPDRVESEALVEAAVELTAFRIVNLKADSAPTGGTFATRLGTARISVVFRSEAARIDLNAAPRELLAGLMEALGATPDDADRYCDRIIAWRTSTARNADDDPENSLYRGAGLSYIPRHGTFQHVGELGLVYGIPAFLVQSMLPYVTIFSGKPQVNILDAAPLVLAALPGMTPANLQILLSEREVPRADPKSLLTLLGPSASMGTVAGSKAVRVLVDVGFDDGRRSGAEVVILIVDNGDEPYRVLSWRNANDGGAGPNT
jgi:general secretion pathway protein K